MEIDNTETLTKVHEVIELSQIMLTKLEENADTDAKKATVENIRIVVNLQNDVIRRLVEHQLNLTDELEKIVNKHTP